MVTRKIIYSLLISTLVSSCGIFRDEIPFDKKALTYKNQFVFDNQFRMDGMYLRDRGENGYRILYFFQDGYYYADGTLDNIIGTTCFQIYPSARDVPYAWGCFIVEDSILKVQTFGTVRYQPFREYKVIERWAEIVNDTTLHFFKTIDHKGKESGLDETFHFRHCENKPDSTNILMKD